MWPSVRTVLARAQRAGPHRRNIAAAAVDAMAAAMCPTTAYEENAGTCPEGWPAPRLMMRVSHSEKNRLTKCDSSVFVDACASKRIPFPGEVVDMGGAVLLRRPAGCIESAIACSSRWRLRTNTQ